MLSGGGDPAPARTAMAAVDAIAWSAQEDRLILLFTRPSTAGPLEPGYIKGYLPGIRENGGQYTHAATWVVQAFALLGDGDPRTPGSMRLLNPIRHAGDPVRRRSGVYKVEPYVVAADVYSRPPHVGRGGWTWYTGSAAWLYRVGLEAPPRLPLAGRPLAIDPCIPADWPGFEITYRHRSATYRIRVENPHGVERGVESVLIDGRSVTVTGEPAFDLADDGAVHEVRVVLGSS